MEISKKTKELIRYQPTRYKSADGNEIVYAYNEEYMLGSDKHYSVHFFIMYSDSMESHLDMIESSLLADIEKTFEDIYEELKDDIIIGGKFFPTRYREITTYLDTDLGLRTPPRESIQDWMERFSLIQNFVMEYSNLDGYGLYKWVRNENK